MCLAEEVVNNAFVDLSPVDFESTGTSSSANPKPSSEALSHPGRKKRKHGATTGSLEEGRETNDFEVGALKNQTTTLISLRIAALEALEALLTVVRKFLIYVKHRVGLCRNIMLLSLSIMNS